MSLVLEHALLRAAVAVLLTATLLVGLVEPRPAGFASAPRVDDLTQATR